MRGSIWSVVALAVSVAFLPLVFSEELSTTTDTVGSELFDVIGVFSDVLGVLILVAAGGLLISLFTGESF
jgi:hypothetical protein